ncbi:MAG TPA: hypothetical protein VFH78_16090 [Candidatus Thermoplasmatota archaeon]|nr:hypothetical protein [Candidatus Thermoplasmatota archaeon]
MGLRKVSGYVAIGLGALGLAVTTVVLGGQLLRARLLDLPILLFGALFGGGMSLAFVLIGRRLVRPPERLAAGAEPRRRAVEPVPLPSAADADSLPKPITACPDCGFLGIRMPTIHDGLWPGGGETGGRFVCPRCDWQGLPVSFPTGSAYVGYVSDLHGQPTPEATA